MLFLLFALRKALFAFVMTSEILRVLLVEKTVLILMVICLGTLYLLLKLVRSLTFLRIRFAMIFAWALLSLVNSKLNTLLFSCAKILLGRMLCWIILTIETSTLLLTRCFYWALMRLNWLILTSMTQKFLTTGCDNNDFTLLKK